MTSISTRTGDKGKTGLFGGKRISKSDPRLHAYGTVDELNAVLGVTLAEASLPEDIRTHLNETQRMLFRIGADLATPLESSAHVLRICEEDVFIVDGWVDGLEKVLPSLQRFILPSGSRVGSLLHLARTVCRRAERYVVSLHEIEEGNPWVAVYINRLSDYLFLAARKANHVASAPETEV